MNAPTSTMLAYIPSPPQGVWDLGPFPLRAYALCIIAGIIVAVWWGNRRWIARGGQEGEVLDVAIWAVPFGLLGGRLYHLITDWKTYFGADAPKEPIDALRIWDGGLGIWGAVALGAVGAWIGARRRGIRLPAFGDAIAPPILLAQAIGRLGNYFNQELYGRETTLPWGLKIYERVNEAGYSDAGLIDGKSNGVVVAIVQPTFLYELLWNVLIVVLLVVIDRKFRIGHGRLFALYIAGYCLGRFFIEMLRDDRAAVANDIAGIRPNLFTAALVFLCAIVYFVVAPKGREQGLEMYHPERAAELEEQGVAGYVDDWYDEDLEDLDGKKVEPAAGSTTLDVLDDEIAEEAKEAEAAEDAETTETTGSAEPAAAEVETAQDGESDDEAAEDVEPSAVDAAQADTETADGDDTEAAESAVDESAVEESALADTDAESADVQPTGDTAPRTAEPDTPASDTVDSEADGSDAEESGTVESHTAESDTVESDAGESDAPESETEAADAEVADSEVTDSEVTDSEVTDSETTDSETTGSGVTESEVGGVAESEDAASDVAENDVTSSAAETGDAGSAAPDEADVEATDADRPDAGETDSTSSFRRRVASRFGRRRRP
ncbi:MULTISPECIES: prolipoprotein diacylglyceryl transferase [Gordonia]|nr:MULTISPECIES: prolipoprotein diacylglyceryl transferase [Gordonia]ATD71339.1 prolipoprotein diacylglyceryl transferase [Gordonia sp. 1D]MDJ0453759.1 prolipoprotein diacylglyceryl transferase [Gordonia amicalis]MDV7076766.1 prolipoprotein diacylglyceryl transferase [Gordonia amicalis]MDV7100387.1 prolipoprotein diacylglyceryl transferase [Gordonia amicalis]MDV7173027.1 prolipoprotein diacylglyceryl transferase [Gordonia amicalis]